MSVHFASPSSCVTGCVPVEVWDVPDPILLPSDDDSIDDSDDEYQPESDPMSMTIDEPDEDQPHQSTASEHEGSEDEESDMHGQVDEAAHVGAEEEDGETEATMTTVAIKRKRVHPQSAVRHKKQKRHHKK
jgi:hypothetical protein